ncbi:AP-4 complex accessory subunit tepsin [Tupaia chinensis]|uniref:AP-4 complex accessory subunit tepsin n=1 Tax=Tupaia chinensis TaxID=246437 RepID=UPI0003C8F4F6|nr:AP-4 complex accessory subunit tepsin [Tupaia chinensis]
MAAAPPLRDRLSFLHRLPILLKGTSDDDVPCPGYLFEEVAKISHESLGSSQCLLEYLLSRLCSSSGRVKLKVLKILLYLCSHGSPSFLFILKRNSAFIQEAAAFAGPPDPLHGNSLYQKVRAAAQDLGSTLFCDTALRQPPSPRPQGLSAAGTGSQSRPHGVLQGFGYSQEQGRTGSAGGVFLSTIQKAAEAVASAVRPGPEGPGTQRLLTWSDTYQPAVPPSTSPCHPTSGDLPSGAILGARVVRHRPGQAGGGWDEPDSSPSSQDSSQNGDTGRGSGSDSLSGASRELGDMAERAEALALSDCQQELNLVRSVTRGQRAFLSREEVQHFLKECGLLNCEAVLELLTRHLGGAGECAQMRALCALAALGGADLLPQEHVLLFSRPRLQELSRGSPGPVTHKATKILRHFEASCGQRPPIQRPPVAPSPTATPTSPSDLLTGTVPLAGSQAFLQPLSSTPLLPRPPVPPAPPDTSSLPAPEEAGERLAGPQQQGAGPERGPEGTGTAQGCPESLFAGMDLVACPRLQGAQGAAEEPHQAPQAPQIPLQGAAAQRPPTSEPSAFPFLNA